MRRILTLTLALLLAACDTGDETPPCATPPRCRTVLVYALPAGATTAELVLSDGAVIAVDCRGAPAACAEAIEVELPGWGWLVGITLRSGGRTWRVNVKPPVIDDDCTRHCTKRYPSTLEPRP